MGIVWFVIGALAAVAKAAVWFIEKTTENAEELHRYDFERNATDDQDDWDD